MFSIGGPLTPIVNDILHEQKIVFELHIKKQIFFLGIFFMDQWIDNHCGFAPNQGA